MLFRKMFAEFLGTFLLVFFGCGSVHTATLYGAQNGLWQIAIVWGLVIAFAIFITGAISGGHLNPAMTLVFALRRDFPKKEILPFWFSQLAGAFLAAAFLFAMFQPALKHYEDTNNVVRGQAGSVITAKCYGEYFSVDNPAVPHTTAFVAEMFGTAVLAMVVFALIDRRNPARPAAHLVPLFIGLTISLLISVIAPLTQAGFNPARDFGPRLFAYFAGWGNVAIPGPNGIGFLTVYIIAPCCGSVIGGTIYDWGIRPALPEQEK